MGLLAALGLPRPKKLVTAGGGAGQPTTTQAAAGGKAVGQAATGAAPAAGSPLFQAALAQARTQLLTLTSTAVTVEKFKIRTELIDAAIAKAAKDEKGALTLLAKVAPAVAAAQKIADDFAAFARRHAGAQALADDLDKHPAREYVKEAIANARKLLAQAQDLAAKRQFPATEPPIQQAEKLCLDAKPIADKRLAYTQALAEARLLRNAFRDLAKSADKDNAANTLLAETQALLDAAEALAKASPPSLDAAIDKLRAAQDKARARVKSWYVDSCVKDVAALRKGVAAEVLAWAQPDLQRIDTALAQAQSQFAAGRWSQTVMAGKLVDRLVPPTQKMLARRGGFEAQLKATTAALTPLRSIPLLAGAVRDMDQTLVQAHACASRESMQFEDGTALLAGVEKRCALLKEGAAAATRYEQEHAAATARVAALEKGGAVPQLEALLKSARRQLADAGKTAQFALGGGVPAQGYASASAMVAQAAADLAAAEQLAKDVGAVAKLKEGAAAAKGDAAQKKSLDALTAAAKALRVAPLDTLAAQEFGRFDAAVAKAEKAMVDKAGDAAVQPSLVLAADTLAGLRALQSEHGRFVAERPPVAKRLAELRADAGMAAKLAERIAPLAKGLEDADKAAASKAFVDAVDALHRAADAATKAEDARGRRAVFDTEDTRLLAAIKKDVKNKARRGELEAMVLVARSQADRCEFDAADKALQGVQVQMQADAAKALAGADLGNAANLAKLVKCAEQMKKLGGEAAMDEVIKGLPDNVDTKAIKALADQRFGIEFVLKADSEAPALKRICEVFARVPQHVEKNASLKKVEHTDPNSNSGAYATSDSSIEMNGRPHGGGKGSTQAFGKALEGQLGPQDQIDEACRPRELTDEEKRKGEKEEVDYLNFAALHEVGHAVDDANTFMAQHGHKADFGGWKRHGADVEEIAKAVAKKFGAAKGVKAGPELVQYALSRIQRITKTANPPAPDGVDGAAWDEVIKLVDGWFVDACVAGKSWWSHSKCANITLGTRIYHEAYNQDWVSYDAAARKRGLTGYQFRAPGEWFAELYAAFHSKRLKPNHPAVPWLKKLKV